MDTSLLPPVHIVILNYKGGDDTVACLDSVLKTNYKNIHIIVCDNYSNDGSYEFIKAWLLNNYRSYFIERYTSGDLKFNLDGALYNEINRQDLNGMASAGKLMGPITFIRSDENLGYAGGNNLGLRYAQLDPLFEYAWLLNNDTIVEADSLRFVLDRMRSSDKIGLCGSKIIYESDRNRVQALGGAKFNRLNGDTELLGHKSSRYKDVVVSEVESSMDLVLGAAVLVSRSFLVDIGLMDDSYFLYFEEIDWALRAEGIYKLGYAHNSIVYHKEGASIGGSAQTPLQTLMQSYLISRNKLRVMKKFFPRNMRGVYFSLTLMAFSRLHKGQVRNFLIIVMNIFGFGSLAKRLARL
jgi:GT2 family glycosyltransferase